MNHCHDCNSDYTTPGTCNCFAPGGKRHAAPVTITPQPYYPTWYPWVQPYYPPYTIWGTGTTDGNTTIKITHADLNVGQQAMCIGPQNMQCAAGGSC